MIQTFCPLCQNQFKAPQSQQGKRIKCPDCGGVFVLEGQPAPVPPAPPRPAATAPAPNRPAAPPAPPRPAAASAPPPPPRPAAPPPPKKATPPRPSAIREEPEFAIPRGYEEDERPSRRGRNESGSGLLIVLLLVGVLLLAGGGAAAWYFLGGKPGKPDEKQAKGKKDATRKKDKDDDEEGGNGTTDGTKDGTKDGKQGKGDEDDEEKEGPIVEPVLPKVPTSAPPDNADTVVAEGPGPDKPGPDKPKPGDPPPPKELAGAFALLGSDDDDKANQGLGSLKTLPVEEARRDAVGKAINPALGRPGTRKQALAVAKRWASKQNLPKLLELLDNREAFPDVADALGAYKDEEAAQAVAKHLADDEQAAQASECLKSMGQAVAEKAVLSYLHHARDGARKNARVLLKGFGTSAEKKLDRAITDLLAPRSESRLAALESVQEAPVDRAKQARVATALGELLTDRDFNVKQAAARCLGAWGTEDSVPLLIKAMDDNAARQEAITALGKLKAAKASFALAKRLSTAGEEDVKLLVAALKAIGPPAEESVQELLTNANFQVRYLACVVLTDIGTRSSIAPLRKNCRVPAALAAEAAKAIRKITARGKAKPPMEKKDADKKDK